jgi:hypothetical protein
MSEVGHVNNVARLASRVRAVISEGARPHVTAACLEPIMGPLS